MLETRTGRCACGDVTLTAVTHKTFGVCHCRMCRRWVGGVWMGVRADNPDINGPVEVWKSSRIAERAKCKTCGSAIWHRGRGSKTYTLGLGLFDDQDGWEMNRQIFIEEQPDHIGFGDKGTGFTGWGVLWALITGRMPR